MPWERRSSAIHKSRTSPSSQLVVTILSFFRLTCETFREIRSTELLSGPGWQGIVLQVCTNSWRRVPLTPLVHRNRLVSSDGWHRTDPAWRRDEDSFSCLPTRYPCLKDPTLSDLCSPDRQDTWLPR